MRKSKNIRLLQQAIAYFDDAQAYKQLYIFFHPSLFQFAVSIIKSKELAEEIVSDVFIKIWEKRHQLDKIDNLKFYLFTAVKNRSVSKLQEQSKNRALNIDEVEIELQDIYFDPEQKMISAEIVHQIQLTIQALPTRCRLIFKLVKEDELSYKEVAELLHLSIKTVENQMSLAFKKLGAALHLKSPQLANIFSQN